MWRIGNEKQILPRKSALEIVKKLRNYEESVAKKQTTDELSFQQERNPAAVSQLLTQIQDLQNKVNSLTDARDVYQRDSGLPLDTRNTMRTSRNGFESLPARERPSSAIFDNSRNLASSS